MPKRNIAAIVIALLTLLSGPFVFSQGSGNGPSPQTPPKGMITVLGRSFAGSIGKGMGNTMVLIGADNPDLRNIIGFSEAQMTELDAARTEVLGKMIQMGPKYTARFQEMTEADYQAVQEELERDLDSFRQHFDKIATEEQTDKARKTVFQFMGGLDSPLMNLDTIQALDVSDEQKKKLQATFKELEEERKAQLEESLRLFEKGVANPNMSEEERRELEAEGKALMARMEATGQKMGEKLRVHLTTEQKELEKKLLADRPAFMPPLSSHQNAGEMPYIPGLDSWKPGQGAPANAEKKKSRRGFPQAE